MIDIAFRQTTSAIDETSSIIVTKPTGTVKGDVIFAIIAWVTSSAITANPAGWVRVGPENSGATFDSSVWYRIVTSADDAVSTWTWTLDVATTWVSVAASYSGADLTQPIDTFGTSTSTGTTIAVPGVNARMGRCLSLLFVVGDGSGLGTSWTEPAPYIERVDATAVAIADTLLKDDGATATVTCTAENTGENFSWRILLRPIWQKPRVGQRRG